MFRKILLAGRHQSYWESIHSPRFLIVVVSLMICSHYISRLWLFRVVSQAGLEAMMAGAPEKPSMHVETVIISKEDYRRFFEERSPLDEGTLALLLKTLVAAKPAVIVVELDTSAESFQALHIASGKIPIIWARRYAGPASSHQPPPPILGGALPGPSLWGYMAYQTGFNGYLTNFPRTVPDTVRESQPTLHWAAACAYENDLDECSRPTSSTVDELPPLSVSLRSMQNLPADLFLEKTGRVVIEKQFSGANEILAGKVVYVGGSYADSDWLPTYFGDRLVPAVQIIASATEAELDKQRLAKFPEFFAILLDLLLSLLLAAEYHFLRPLPAMLLTIVGIGTLVLYLSYAAFLLGVALDFVPFAVGIWLELMLESSTQSH